MFSHDFLSVKDELYIVVYPTNNKYIDFKHTT